MNQDFTTYTNKDKFDTLMYLTRTGVYEIDPAADKGEISGSLLEIFDVRDGSPVTIDNYFNKIPEAYRKKVKNSITNAYKASDETSLTFPFQKDNEFIWVKVNGKALDENSYLLVHEQIKEDESFNDIHLSYSLQGILNYIPIPLIVITEDEEIAFINRTFTETTGYNKSDLHRLTDWVSKAYGEKAGDAYSLFKKLFHIPQKIDDGIYEIKVKSGEIKLFHFYTAPLGKNNKGQKQILSMAADVSESFRKDRLINQQNEELTVLNENLPYLLISADAEGEILFANNNVITYTSYTLEQIKARWIKLIHPDDQQKVLQQRAQSSSTGENFNVDLRLKHYNDTFRWFNFKALPIKDKNGNITKWLGSGIDIHEQYISQQQLTKSLQTEVSHLDEIIESLPQLAWTSDADGNMDYFNKRWYEFTRQSPNEALGTGWQKVLHPEDAKDALDQFYKGIKSGEDLELEARLLDDNDQTYCWHLIKALPVKNHAEKVNYWIGTATNIHEQKMLEYNKGEFLNVASHELRTPLTTLTGYLQLMQDEVDKKEPENLDFFLKKSLDSTDRINRLINDLLNLSNVESGKIAEFHKEKINFKQFIKEIVNNYQQLYPEKEFILNISGTNIRALGNAFRIEQVIDNLITNAIKYAPDSPVYINLKKKEQDVLVEVTDEGKGIPQNKLSAVFDRFYRIKDNHISSGLGIGLFISKEIIQQHNGKIWAERNNEKGTTFKFTIPIA